MCKLCVILAIKAAPRINSKNCTSTLENVSAHSVTSIWLLFRNTHGSLQVVSIRCPQKKKTAFWLRLPKRKCRHVCAPSPNWRLWSSSSVCSRNTASRTRSRWTYCTKNSLHAQDGPTRRRVRMSSTWKGMGYGGGGTGQLTSLLLHTAPCTARLSCSLWCSIAPAVVICLVVFCVNVKSNVKFVSCIKKLRFNSMHADAYCFHVS